MKLRTGMVAGLALSLFSAQIALGQGPSRSVNTQDLEKSQRLMVSAIRKISTALPIYNGHRAKAVDEAHWALATLENTTWYGVYIAKPRLGKEGTASTYTAKQIAESAKWMQSAYADLDSAEKLLGTDNGTIVRAKPLKEVGLAIKRAMAHIQAGLRPPTK